MLNEISDHNWINYVEYDIMGKFKLAERFFNYKEKMIRYQKILEKHFTRTMLSIQAGLSEVVESEESKEGRDFKFSRNEKWTCRVCLVKNKIR